MKKLDKEFKDAVNDELKEDTYIASNVLARIAIFVIALVVLCGVGGVVYTRTIGKAQQNAEREVFKNSVAYTEQAASFLAKSYQEYNEAESKTDKSTIMEYVIMRYPNLDTDSIDNDTLRQFYIKCLNN